MICCHPEYTWGVLSDPVHYPVYYPMDINASIRIMYQSQTGLIDLVPTPSWGNKYFRCLFWSLGRKWGLSGVVEGTEELYIVWKQLVSWGRLHLTLSNDCIT